MWVSQAPGTYPPIARIPISKAGPGVSDAPPQTGKNHGVSRMNFWSEPTRHIFTGVLGLEWCRMKLIKKKKLHGV